MTMHDFCNGVGPVPAHQHPNGGGWVEDTANVDQHAYVGPDAEVYEDARVYPGARVYGDSRVHANACLWIDAVVWSGSRVSGNSILAGERRGLNQPDLLAEMRHACSLGQIIRTNRTDDEGQGAMEFLDFVLDRFPDIIAKAEGGTP